MVLNVDDDDDDDDDDMMMMLPLHVGKADQNECYFLHGPSFFYQIGIFRKLGVSNP